MSDNDKIIGIAIGGTKCAVVLGERKDERLLAEKTAGFATFRRGPEEIIRELFAVIDGWGVKPCSVGIISGGPLDEKRGIIQSPPNLVGWDDVHITEKFAARYGSRVTLCNDAGAGALAEWEFGAGKMRDNMVFLTFGTGMGAGLILNGKPYKGACGFAGEVGHIALEKTGNTGYGKKGSFEGLVSGDGIAQTAKRIARRLLRAGKPCSFCTDINRDEITAKSVAEKAAAGYADAIEVYRITGEYLGRGLAVIADVLNPDCIVIGGIYARNERLLSQFALPVFKREALKATFESCEILPSALGENIDVYASLCVAYKGENL